MLRTVLASAAVALLGWLSASWLTEGFDVLTAEGARRRAVATVPVPAPHVTLLGTGIKGINGVNGVNGVSGVNGESLYSLLAAPGRVTIVSFIYTRCPTVCQALGSSFQQLQAAVSAPALHSGIQLLSISFDPANDDMAQLHRYAMLWRADPRHWHVAAVPDAAQLQALLKAWQVVVVPDGLGGYEHNSALLVVDAGGRLVRIFDDSDSGAALAFARSLLQAAHPG